MARVENYTDNYYLALGVSRNADLKDIKTAFRRLARQYHPDLNPDDPVSAEKFKQISQAYDILSDPAKRRRYDLRSPFNRRQTQTKQTTTRSTSSQTATNYGSMPRTAQDYYRRGGLRVQNKEYRQAIEDYSKAVELNPKFIDAYLKRCEMRYKMGDNQGVLDDCYKILKINQNIAKAHYYQGRARYSLGYAQTAIQSYNSAIANDNNYPQAYYYRGIAYREMMSINTAIQDFNKAAELFRQQKNYEAYRRSQEIINELSREDSVSGWFDNLINNSLMTLSLSLFNPGGGLLPAFSRLNPRQAKQVGTVFGLFSSVCFVCAYFMMGFPLILRVWQLFLVGTIPFVTLTISGSIMRYTLHHRGRFSTDVFIAGMAIAPIAFTSLLLGFIPLSAYAFTIPLALVGFAYSILSLNAGYAQILNITESKAALIVAIMLLLNSYICLSLMSSLFFY